MGSWVEKTGGKAVAGRTSEVATGIQINICMQINWEKPLGSETDHTTQSFSVGK